MIPRYVRWQAALGRGDLHPGGRAASGLLTEWLEPWRGGALVEVGAGAGMSAERYAKRGWEVIATEPDPDLAARCSARGLMTRAVGVSELPRTFGRETISAVLSESVLFALDLPEALSCIAQVLRPGGALALSEMVWTEAVTAEEARSLHDASKQAFGIAVASAERWTWADWCRMLGDAGFQVQRSERLADGSGMTRTLARGAEVVSALRNPRAAVGLWMARRAPVPRVPADWFESWCALAVKA